MFSVEHEFRSLKPARPAKKENGLHTFTTGVGDISDNYYGGQTMAETVELSKRHQPTIACDFLVKLDTPHSRNHGKAVAVRYRPPKMVWRIYKAKSFAYICETKVAAQALSAISYSRIPPPHT